MAYPDMEITINPQKPRSKSFEVMLCKEDGTGIRNTCGFHFMQKKINITFLYHLEIVIWSGIKKGPPRKLKFPEAQVIISSIQEQLVV